MKLQKLKTFLKKETAGKEISVPLAIEETCTLNDLTKRTPELTKMTKVWKIPLKLLKNSTHHAINSKKYVNNSTIYHVQTFAQVRGFILEPTAQALKRLIHES